MTSVATTVQDEYILDTFRPIGDLINSVFTKNVFGKEPYLSKRKMKSGQTPVPFSTHVIGWRMCREICRSMNTIVICIGFSSYQNECTFYKAVGQTNMKSNPVHRMTDKEADARSPVTRLYGVVRSPRAGDSLIRPYVCDFVMPAFGTNDFITNSSCFLFLLTGSPFAHRARCRGMRLFAFICIYFMSAFVLISTCFFFHFPTGQHVAKNVGESKKTMGPTCVTQYRM